MSDEVKDKPAETPPAEGEQAAEDSGKLIPDGHPINFETSPDYNLVSYQGTVTGQEVPTVLEIFEKAGADDLRQFVIVNFAECSETSSKALRDLSQLYLHLKKTNKQLRLINVNENIKEIIKKNGLDRILVCKLSLRGALVDFGLATKREIDAKFINPFLESTMKVLKVQCFIEVKPGKPFIKKEDTSDFLGDVSGVIGIVSDTFNGALAITFPEDLFCRVASNMLGEEIPKVTDETSDMVGELCNIILGQAKLSLLALGYEIKQAIPTVITGKEHKVKYFSSSATIVLPFESDHGTFYVQICSSRVDEKKAA